MSVQRSDHQVSWDHQIRYNRDHELERRISSTFCPRISSLTSVAGDKAGVNQKRFYQTLIKKADDRFKQHLQDLEDNKP
jgi:hypothetical protein